MTVFAVFRSPKLSNARNECLSAEADVVTITSEACQKYRLIADYMRRPQMIETFFRKANDMRKTQIPEAQIKMNNDKFPAWLGPLFTSFFIVTVAPMVPS